MILKTIKTLTKFYKYKIVYPFIKFLYTWKTVRYYSNNLKKIYLYELLRDMCYACSTFNVYKCETDNITFKYNIVDTDNEKINIDIFFKDDHLSLSLSNGVLHYSFNNQSHFHDGVYVNDHFDETCNDMIKFEIYSVLLITIHEVLTFIFNQTPKYII